MIMVIQTTQNVTVWEKLSENMHFVCILSSLRDNPERRRLLRPGLEVRELVFRDVKLPA